MATKSTKSSKISPYSAVGIIAAQSLGEPGTQMSLEAGEKVLVSTNGRIKSLKIGKFIDALMQKSECRNFEGSEVCALVGGEVYVPSLDQDGRIRWKKVLEVSRHKTNKKLMKLNTRSGRSIIATGNHSFVIRQNGSILPVPGKELSVGSRIPVLRNLPANEEQSALELEDYLPKNKCWFGSELKKALLGSTQFTVPVGPDQLRNHAAGMGSFEIEEGFVYPKQIHSRSRIPESITMDEEFGWFIGAYLAEGNATKYYISISNTDEGYLSNVRKVAQKFSLTTNEYDNHRGFSKGHDLRLNSSILSELLMKACGSGAKHKYLPQFAFGANEKFVGSLLKAYFDGDGNVSTTRKVIRASSASEELIDGIAILLNRMGILSSKRKGRKEYSLSISYRYAGVFKEKIGLEIPKKKDALDELVELSKKNQQSLSYDSVDMVAGFGDVFIKLAEKLSIPKRTLKNFTKRQAIGRNTLRKWIEKMGKIAKEKAVDIESELEYLRALYNEDVFWDEIISIDYVEPSSGYVYDFSVEGLETFTTFEGIVTHNTMRTFHYAGIAEHVPTDLPRLIELVDAKKEPKKSIVEIHLLKEYRAKESSAKALAREIESVLLPEIATMQEDLASKRISIMLRKDDSKLMGVSNEMLKEAVKKTVGTNKVEQRGDKIIVKLKAEKEKPLKDLRKLGIKLSKCLVKGVAGIRRAVVIKEKGEYFIRASGCNIKDIVKLKKVDISRIYTNSIMEIEKMFGIEAARNALIKEMHTVMELQGLAVDIRHIMLLADAMASDGKIKSIGRHGLSGEKAGVMGRAAFEETIKHLVNASIIAEDDNLVGVSENIIVGQTIPVGTGRIKLGMKAKK